MPGLPPSSPRGVVRHESTRSDSSNTSQGSASCKKVVSFNRAVRVKKYQKGGQNGGQPEGKRFWFRVHKNRRRPSPEPRQQVIYYGNGHHHDDAISYHPNPSALNYPSLTTSECGTQTLRRGGSHHPLLGNESTPLHPSQMPSDPPAVRRNHVKKIVHRFNEEAVFQPPPTSPPGSPRLHSTPKHVPPPPPPPLPPSPPQGDLSPSRVKKHHPIVNGVKVMFGMGAKREDPPPPLLNGRPTHRGGLFKTEIVLSDGSETDVKSADRFLYGDYQNALVAKQRSDLVDATTSEREDNDQGHYYYDDDPGGRRSRYHVQTFDSGNHLLLDTSDLNTTTSKTDAGERVTTVGEKHQLWRNDRRIVVCEEPSPRVVRRKAKSHNDLLTVDDHDRLDKGVSTDELFRKKDATTRKSKDAWLGTTKSSTKDKGVQCSNIPLDEPEELYGFGRYKIIRPRNGVVSAYSQPHSIDASTNGKDSSAIYSQVDKSKKKKNSEKKKKTRLFSEEGRLGSLFKSRSEPLYIGPPPPRQQPDDDFFFDDDNSAPERTVKTSKKSFGFKLAAHKENNEPEEPDWYNIDGDVEQQQQQQRRRRLQSRGSPHRDIAEVRQELVVGGGEETDVSSSLSNGEQQKRAGSVVRELDYRKREISYENVPRPGEQDAGDRQVQPGLWYREADEDYRKEMAQSEVSYPAGNSVGSDRFYTVDRRGARKLPPPSPRAYTLDRRHLNKAKPVANTSGVRILVNGKEPKESGGQKKKKPREEPSSVQSDPLCVRGGLAAAYQARQRANVRRSNSTASGLGHAPAGRRIGSSELSANSSESESGRVRRPLVMYIPGVSHPDRTSEPEDRLMNRSIVARSHSVMSPTRPPRRTGRRRPTDDFFEEEDEDRVMPLASDRSRQKPPRVPTDGRKQSDIQRRHSMPKDTKFSWLKWRIRGKPTREP